MPDDFKVLPQNGRSTSRVHERYEMDQQLKGDFDIPSGDGKEFLKQLLAKESSSSRRSNSSSSSGGSSSSSSSGGSRRKTTSSSTSQIAKVFSKLTVDEDHGVRKVTPERVYSLALMPSNNDVVVAAGDKKGNVGIWNVGSNEASDGVFATRPHSATVSHLSFSKTDHSKLITSSYDGSIKELDATKGVFREIVSFEDKSLYEFDSSPDMSTSYVADDDGEVHQIDFRNGEIIQTWAAHAKKINTLRVHPTRPWLLATASLDRSVCLWDIRRMSGGGSSGSSRSSSPVPVYQLPHALSVSCAVFSPDGQYMLSNGCGPNHVKVYDVASMLVACESKKKNNKTMPLVQPKEKFYHDNRTGRWLTKFKPSFDPKHNNVFVMGCMDQPRCIEIFQCDGGVSQIMRMRDDEVRSVQSLNEFHVSKNVIASANSSGRISIWS